MPKKAKEIEKTKQNKTKQCKAKQSKKWNKINIETNTVCVAESDTLKINKIQNILNKNLL